jgi:hypothetical protein
MHTLKTKPKNNYIGHGWEGKIYYDENLSIQDIAAQIQFILKKQYPECKFSISTSPYLEGKWMIVTLVSAPFDAFLDPTRASHYVNYYKIEESKVLTDEAKEILIFTTDIATKFNFRDSDERIDYFHANFYLEIMVGRWNKPFLKR